jgi:hypothetical protein
MAGEDRLKSPAGEDRGDDDVEVSIMVGLIDPLANVLEGDELVNASRKLLVSEGEGDLDEKYDVNESLLPRGRCPLVGEFVVEGLC